MTEDILSAARSAAGGWSKRQLELLGVGWPPAEGWKPSVLGRWFPNHVVAEFLRERPT